MPVALDAVDIPCESRIAHALSVEKFQRAVFSKCAGDASLFHIVAEVQSSQSDIVKIFFEITKSAIGDVGTSIYVKK